MAGDPAQLFDIDKRMAALERKYRILPESGGGGTSGGMSDDWKAMVETQLGQLHTDVRHLLFGLIGLAAMIGGLYIYFNSKFETVNQRISAVEIQVQKLEGKVDANHAVVNGKLDQLLDRKDAGNRSR